MRKISCETCFSMFAMRLEICAVKDIFLKMFGNILLQYERLIKHLSKYYNIILLYLNISNNNSHKILDTKFYYDKKSYFMLYTQLV